MRAAVLFFVLLAFPMLLFAGDEVIEGGFGIKLGQQINKEDLPESMNPKESDIKDDEIIYQFVPEHPYKPLSEYLVFVTPHSGKVYQIQALGVFKKRTKCVAELEELEKKLAGKYGGKNVDASIQFTKVDKINFGKGARKIIASCTGFFSKHTLKLIYVDNELKKAGIKEKPGGAEQGASETEERDASGL